MQEKEDKRKDYKMERNSRIDSAYCFCYRDNNSNKLSKTKDR